MELATVKRCGVHLDSGRATKVRPSVHPRTATAPVLSALLSSVYSTKKSLPSQLPVFSSIKGFHVPKPTKTKIRLTKSPTQVCAKDKGGMMECWRDWPWWRLKRPATLNVVFGERWRYWSPAGFTRTTDAAHAAGHSESKRGQARWSAMLASLAWKVASRGTPKNGLGKPPQSLTLPNVLFSLVPVVVRFTCCSLQPRYPSCYLPLAVSSARALPYPSPRPPPLVHLFLLSPLPH